MPSPQVSPLRTPASPRRHAGGQLKRRGVEASGGREGAERWLRREGLRQATAVTPKRAEGCVLDAERESFVKRGRNSARPGGFIFASDPAVYSASARFSQFVF